MGYQFSVLAIGIAVVGLQLFCAYKICSCVTTAVSSALTPPTVPSRSSSSEVGSPYVCDLVDIVDQLLPRKQWFSHRQVITYLGQMIIAVEDLRSKRIVSPHINAHN